MPVRASVAQGGMRPQRMKEAILRLILDSDNTVKMDWLGENIEAKNITWRDIEYVRLGQFLCGGSESRASTHRNTI